MAKGKPKSPGDNSSRGHVHGRQSVWETRRTGLKGMEIKSNREELSASRRAEVYQTNPELFATEDPYAGVRRKSVPRKGTPEREEFDRMVGVMVGRGMSQLQISVELETALTTIGIICRENGFKGQGAGKRKS